jgi:hypothetical protein
MSRVVSLLIEDTNITSHDRVIKGARLVWVAPGLSVYVKGSLDGYDYERCANLALAVCYEMNIPGFSLRRYKK